MICSLFIRLRGKVTPRERELSTSRARVKRQKMLSSGPLQLRVIFIRSATLSALQCSTSCWMRMSSRASQSSSPISAANQSAAYGYLTKPHIRCSWQSEASRVPGPLGSLVTTDTLAQERQNAYGKLACETPVSCALVRARLASASEGYAGVSPGQSGRARSVVNGDDRVS